MSVVDLGRQYARHVFTMCTIRNQIYWGPHQERKISSFCLLLYCLFSWSKTEPAECRLKIILFHPTPISIFYLIPFTTISYPKQLRRVLWGAKWGPFGPCGFTAKFSDTPWVEILEDYLPPAPWSSITDLFFLSGTLQIQRVMTMMIRDHEVLFPKSKDAPLSPPAQKNDPKKPPVARSSVGWDATEDAPISRTDSFSNTVRCRGFLLPSNSFFCLGHSV